jgi:protocatechuate 3,4-dioxygenase beta subunit
MMIISIIRAIAFLVASTIVSSADNTIIGGGCDGCELMYINMPAQIPSISKSPAWESKAQKLLITGKIYQLDGKTPAKNVIVYYWQTDDKGNYVNHELLDSRAKRHGYIRGWVQSDDQGKYSIYTIKPKAYPNRKIPAHIHLSIKEPQVKNEYYVDNLEFDYDKFLTSDLRKKHQKRGGSGILRAFERGDLIIAEHNIILGLNIPNYPIKLNSLISGLDIGEDFPSITPYHAWGPDKGTNTCPVCKYGRYFGIMYFVGNQFNDYDVKNWLLYLEKQSLLRGEFLKVYLIYGNDKNYNFNQSNTTLSKLGEKLNLKNIAITFVPSFQDKQSDVYLTKIDPEATNTFIIYKNRNIIGNYMNFQATAENFKQVETMLNKHENAYFKLPISTKTQ